MLAATNRQTDAKHEFETAITLDPDNFEALYNLAGIEADNSNFFRAAELLERALKQREDADAHQLLGNIYAQAGRLADALDQFKAVQLLRPHDIMPHRQLAQLYAQMGQLRDAISEQNAALALDPKNADDWNNLGVLQARDGDTASARRDFQHALALTLNTRPLVQTWHVSERRGSSLAANYKPRPRIAGRVFQSPPFGGCWSMKG